MTRFDVADTIAAVASPSGAALRGIVRISGPQAHRVALHGFEPARAEPAPPARAPVLQRGTLEVPALARAIPCNLALWPGKRTYTGEPLAELHTSGSVPLLQAVLASRLQAGARLAEPGEFTLRAFLNGRIDLTQAEAVLAVIDARHESELQAALGQLAGGLRQQIDSLRRQLLGLLAQTEAGLDFPEEPDVERTRAAATTRELVGIVEQIDQRLSQLALRDRPRSRPRVVLVGPPNAGKSSLYNALLGDEHALVSHEKGTTRDVLSASLKLGGLEVELLDTAGADHEVDSITQRAQILRAQSAQAADLLLVCKPIDDPASEFQIPPQTNGQFIQVWTKADRGRPPSDSGIMTSAHTGQGLPALKHAIVALLQSDSALEKPQGHASARCLDSLANARAAVAQALVTVETSESDEFLSLELRSALDALGQVVGDVVTDDILDLIFQNFCIGK